MRYSRYFPNFINNQREPDLTNPVYNRVYQKSFWYILQVENNGKHFCIFNTSTNNCWWINVCTDSQHLHEYSRIFWQWFNDNHLDYCYPEPPRNPVVKILLENDFSRYVATMQYFDQEEYTLDLGVGVIVHKSANTIYIRNYYNGI